MPASPGTLAILPLRAGSKGLPGKNLLPVAGKPLYRHTLDQALRTVGRCAITTDIPEILDADLPEGSIVVPRPACLADDKTPMAPVLLHAFEQLERMGLLADTAVLMQATSPLRRDEDVLAAVDLHAKGEFDLVMSVTTADSGILKYGFLRGGRFEAVSKPEYCFQNRQDLARVVRPNGAVYVFSTRLFRRNGGFPTGSIGAIEIPQALSIDIDGAADLRAAEESLLRTAYAMEHREPA
ncbi:MAG TPA: acylneuraminate cytidylyltransferase family protein [Rhizobiaceae bacterium]|nr:acylneuraminate cytidylyltransferase family protein [Rhizobiaceae bacterium]